MNTKIEAAIEVTRWASIVDHIKNNRIEYLVLAGLLHLVGITNKAYSHVSGVCL